MNKKNKDVDINLTYEIIKLLAILPLVYSGSIDYIKENVEHIDVTISQIL